MSLNETINNLGDSIVNLVDKKTRRGLTALDYGEVSYDKEVFEDIRKYKYSTFDINKYTPRWIEQKLDTKNGIVSGGTRANYIGIMGSGGWNATTNNKAQILIPFTYKRGTGEYSNVNQMVVMSKATTPGAVYRSVEIKPNGYLTIDTNNTFQFIDGEKYWMYIECENGVGASYKFGTTNGLETGTWDFEYNRGITTVEYYMFFRGYFFGTLHLADAKLWVDDNLITSGYNGFQRHNLGIPTSGEVSEDFFPPQNVAALNYSQKYYNTLSYNVKFRIPLTVDSRFNNSQVAAIKHNGDNFDMFALWYYHNTNTLAFSFRDCSPTVDVSKVLDNPNEWHTIRIEETLTHVKATLDGEIIVDKGTTIATPYITHVSIAGSLDIFTAQAEYDLKETYLEVDSQIIKSYNKTGVDIIKEDSWQVQSGVNINDFITEDRMFSGKADDNSYTPVIFSQENHAYPTKSVEIYEELIFNDGGHNHVQNTVHLAHDQGNLGYTRFDYTKSGVAMLGLSGLYTDITGITVPNISSILIKNGDLVKVHAMYTESKLSLEVWVNNVRYYEESELIDKHFISSGTLRLYYGAGGNYMCHSKVNLSATKVYIDGDLVWQPCLRIPYTETKAGYKVAPYQWKSCLKQLKEEKGCAPYYTIDENEKENFDKSINTNIENKVLIDSKHNSCITINSAIHPILPEFANITESKYESIKIKFKRTSTDTVNKCLFSSYQPYNEKKYIWLYMNSQSDAIGFNQIGYGEPQYAGNYIVSLNTIYNVVLYLDKVQHIIGFNLYDENNTLLYQISTPCSAPSLIGSHFTRIGANDWAQDEFHGEIYLDSIKFYADGKLIWTPYLNPSYTLPMGDVYGVLSAKANSSEISHYAMPSSKYVDLTLGASGATYTAPANGWLQLVKVAGVVNSWQVLRNSSSNIQDTRIGVTATDTLTSYVPASKGDEVYVAYTSTGDVSRFRFIYAKGEKQ